MKIYYKGKYCRGRIPAVGLGHLTIEGGGQIFPFELAETMILIKLLASIPVRVVVINKLGVWDRFPQKWWPEKNSLLF